MWTFKEAYIFNSKMKYMWNQNKNSPWVIEKILKISLYYFSGTHLFSPKVLWDFEKCYSNRTYESANFFSDESLFFILILVFHCKPEWAIHS